MKTNNRAAAQNRNKRRRVSTPRNTLKGEMKYFDTVLVGQNIQPCTTTWVLGTRANGLVPPALAVNCLFAPTQGAGVNQRIGKSCKVLKIKIRGQLNVPVQAAQSVADSSTQIRLLVVWDKKCNSATITPANVIADGVDPISTLNQWQNIDHFGRYVVLKDKFFNITNLNLAGSPTTGDVIQAGLVKSFKFNINFKTPVDVRFNGTNGGTSLDLVDNSFAMLASCSSAAYAPTITYNCRVCYKE